MAYYSMEGQDKTIWSAHGENLSAQDIHNMILVLQSPNAVEMFTPTELKIINMVIKTHIMKKAMSTTYEIPKDDFEKFENENRFGKTLKKENKEKNLIINEKL